MGGTATAAPRTGSGRLGRAGREVVRRFETGTGIDLRPLLRKLRTPRRASARRDSDSNDIKQLKADVQELRGLGGRVAELTDLVTELLIVAAKREDPEFQRLVTKYLEGV